MQPIYQDRQAQDRQARPRQAWHAMLATLLGFVVVPFLFAESGLAQGKPEKTFNAVITDAHGTETEVTNLVFYWEEKIDETHVALHELRHVPVKRGAATINVKFEDVKQIETKPGADNGAPLFVITLTRGKTGEFPLAIAGQFKGESDFGEVLIPVAGLKKIVFTQSR